MKSTTGQTVTGRYNISFAQDITEEELKQMQDKPDVQKDALYALKELKSQLIVDALLSATHARRGEIERLLRVAPDFSI